jgi:hypothetical protein
VANSEWSKCIRCPPLGDSLGGLFIWQFGGRFILSKSPLIDPQITLNIRSQGHYSHYDLQLLLGWARHWPTHVHVMSHAFGSEPPEAMTPSARLLTRLNPCWPTLPAPSSSALAILDSSLRPKLHYPAKHMSRNPR